MSRIVDIEPVITKLENTQKQNVHILSKRELVDAIADIMDLKPIDAVSVVRCKDCKYYNERKVMNCSYHINAVKENWFCSQGEKVKKDG